MTERADALKRRTKQFALDVLRFVRRLPANEEKADIGGQKTAPGRDERWRKLPIDLSGQITR